MWIPVTLVTGDRCVDLHLQVSGPVTPQDVRAALGLAADVVFTVEGGAIRPGVVLRAGPPAEPPAPQGRRSLEVVAGPDGALVIDLPERGEVTIGRDPACTAVLADTAVSRVHAVLDCTSHAVTLRDAGSANGTGVDGRLLTAPERLPGGATVQIGDNQLRFRDEPDRTPAVALVPQPDGTLRLDRGQRFAEPPATEEVRLPPNPADRGRAPAGMGWAAVSSLVLGAVAYLAFRNPALLLLSGASTATLLVSALVAHLRARRDRTRAAGRHAEDRAAAQDRIESLLAAEGERRRRQAPGPADVVAAALRPGARLWSGGSGTPTSSRCGSTSPPSRPP